MASYFMQRKWERNVANAGGVPLRRSAGLPNHVRAGSHLGNLLLPVSDLNMIHEQPRLHLLADQPARDRVWGAAHVDQAA